MRISPSWLPVILLLCAACHHSPHPHATPAQPPERQPPAANVSRQAADTALPLNTNDTAIVLEPHAVHLAKGDSLKLRIPRGYRISIAAEGMHRLRFLTRSPDGRLFATDMYDLTDNRHGKVYVFDGWDSAAHRFGKVHTYLEGLHNPNQLAFYRLNGRDVVYVAETDRLAYYEYHAGDTLAAGAPTVVATFPAYGLSYKYGGWHLTRSLAFHKGRLYVSVGSSCNACIEKEAVRATVISMNPDGSDQRFFATGLRNSVAIKWLGNRLWATGMGRDLIGDNRPDDTFLQVDSGVVYNWPYYYQEGGRMMPDKKLQDSARLRGIAIPAAPPAAFCSFRAHSAPLGFDYFGGFADTALNNAFLVALHGSTKVHLQRGYAIVKVLRNNRCAPVVDGFLAGKTDGDRKGRPCDVMMNDPHSFFFTDDLNGVLYCVWRE